MRKILFILLSFLIISPVYAIQNGYEEVLLDNNVMKENDDNGCFNLDGQELVVGSAKEEKPQGEKTLREKLNDVYHLEITEIDKPTYLFEEILTKKFSKDSFWDSVHVGGGYTAFAEMDFIDNGSIKGSYNFSAISPFIEGKSKNGKLDARLMLRFNPQTSMNWMQYLVSDAYIGLNVIPHHRIQIGSFRPPVGYEGQLSTYVLDYMNRSYIASTFGTTRKFGARIKGDYKLVDYDFGGYSSDTFWQEFFPGGEFIGWVNLKPLGLTDGKYGNLVLGGGIQTGHRNCNYTVASTHLGYYYKKFAFDFEYANADGYNGFQMQATDKKAAGFYASASYRITPKLQVLACYDQFDPDKNVSSNMKRAYTFGINYFIKGQGLKLMFNYAFCQNQAERNSHAIMLGTQLLL